ncbi:MAG TPA: M2 family metallopeptidase [Actinomycetota bacterium]|nr:M2 family metallopeptidase [Actinomycetota bacterium]
MERQSPHRLVEALEHRIRPLEIEFHRAYWDSQVDVTPENERRRAELELELRRVKGDPDALRAVTAALDDGANDPLLRRQLEVLRLSLTGNQMDEAKREQVVALSTSLESDFAAYRPELDGQRLSDNDIERILKTSDDADLRRRSWEASKEVGGVVADRVRELARLRNATAHDLGYADYYGMALDLQELEEGWLFGILDDIERRTDEPFRRWKSELDARLARRFQTDELYPWHYADPFFQQLPPDGKVSLEPLLADASAPDLAARWFERIGIDLSGVMGASDLYPRERKSQHAFCMDVDRSGRDVRILANVVPGERWTEVMLHESGHAAYDVSIDPRVPYLLHRPPHTFVTEAIAILSGRRLHDPRWLVEVGELAPDDVASIEEPLRRAPAAASLLFARWVLVVVHFERDLYLDPESDLDARWWELVERFQLVRRPEGRSAPDWAAKVHIAAAPAYYQNYLLGEMLASQIEHTCEREGASLVDGTAAGEWLTERVFRPGSSKRWDAVVEHATGRGLSADDFAADLAPAVP